jgi:hypothetical protein
MVDRSSRPNASPRQANDMLVARIIALRRQRLTGRHIAIETGVSSAVCSDVPAFRG